MAYFWDTIIWHRKPWRRRRGTYGYATSVNYITKIKPFGTRRYLMNWWQGGNDQEPVCSSISLLLTRKQWFRDSAFRRRMV